MVLIMDCCYSGRVKLPALGRAAKEAKAFYESLVPTEQEEGKTRELLAASDVRQEAYESPELGHGVFSHFLIEAMKGEADFDGDGWVDLSEMETYTTGRVSDYVDAHFPPHEQTPMRKGQVKGKVPLVVVPRRKVGTIQIYSEPWADVYLDQDYVPRGYTPLVIEGVEVGPHTLRLEREGYLPIETTITVEQGETLSIAEQLEAG